LNNEQFEHRPQKNILAASFLNYPFLILMQVAPPENENWVIAASSDKQNQNGAQNLPQLFDHTTGSTSWPWTD
jgi:hypothetical protein